MTEPLPLTIEPTVLELVEFGWDAEALARPDQYLRPLLACGHYDRPTFVASSDWDFPHEERECPECGAEVQMHVSVQAALSQPQGHLS